MTSDKTSETITSVTIRLKGYKPGTSLDDLISTLQQLYKKKTKDELKGLIEKAPLVLTRQATKEKAVRIKHLLESKGAIITISENIPDDSSTDGEPLVKTETDKQDAEESSTKPEAGSDHIERRRKPRIHKSIDLHPMGIGEILDRSVRLLKDHFPLFFIIILIPQAVYFIITKGSHILLFQGFIEPSGLGVGIKMGVSFFIAIAVFLILQFWAQGALIFAVSERYMGHGATIGGAYGAIKKKFIRILGTIILMVVLLGLIIAAGGIVMGILVPALNALGANKILIGFIVAVLVILLAILFIRIFFNWILVDKVVVIEDIGWIKALRRSKDLMSSNPEEGFWKKTKIKATLILLVGLLIAIAIGFLIQVPSFLFAFIFSGNLIFTTILEIINLLLNSVVTVFTAIAMILFYYDIRLRKEGFDLKLMAENL